MENTPLLPMKRKLVKGKFRFKRKNISTRQLSGDLFHTLLDLPFWALFGVFVAVFSVFSVAFAVVYQQYDRRILAGELGVADSFGKALIFSGNMLLTIGIFSSEDLPLTKAWPGFATLGLAAVLSICLAVHFLGLLFQRITSGKARGRSILFSPLCAITEVAGNFAMEFEVVEARRHQLIGSSVAVFAFDLQKLTWKSLNVISDHLFPALPNRVVVSIDQNCPLWPGRKNVKFAELVEHIRGFEIVAVIEGLEPVTGAPVRALRSYAGEAEIHSAYEFPVAVEINSKGEVVVDLGHFK